MIKNDFLIMRRFVISSLIMTTTITTSAFKVGIDTLVYDLSGISATVIGANYGSDTVRIPPKVVYDGLEYTVNRLTECCFVNYHYTASDRRYRLYINGKVVENVQGNKRHPDGIYGVLPEDDILSTHASAASNSWVKVVYLPETIEQIGDYAFCNTQIKEVHYSEGLLKIGNYACNTPTLVEAKLPHTLKSIGYCAFLNSKIKEIIIPEAVTEMGVDAFKGCSLLRKMIYLGAEPPSNWTATSLTYVPSKTAYNNPSCSINDASIIEMISFSQTNFTYTGKAPQLTWTNNMEGYSVSMEMPTLNAEVGSYEIVIPTTFKKGDESFTAYIPYKYTIEPVKLKAKVNNSTRIYGDPNPEFGIIYTGFVNGENESELTIKPVVTTSADETSSVGTYPITISGGEAKNYTMEYEQGSLTVKKASLAIQVKDAEKTYGDDNPNFALIYTGLKNNEIAPEWTTVPQFITAATKKSGCGSYDVTVICEPKNYTISANTSGKLTIKKAPLIIKANNATMDYCGKMPSYSYTYSGFVNGDDETSLLSKPTITTEATSTSNAGEYAITPEKAQANNYDFNYVPGTLTIKKRSLVVKAVSESRLYGDENPAFILEYEGFVNNETKAVVDVEPIISTIATIQSRAGRYELIVSGGKADNYELAYQSGVLTIMPRPLNVLVGNYERAYGEDNPVFSVEFDGFVCNDTRYSLTTLPTAHTSANKTSNVGTYVIEVSGGYSPNYTFNYGTGQLNIVKAEQTFTWEQDLTNLKIGDQIELQAYASSNLPITFTMDSNSYAEIYKAGSKTYMECKTAGTFHIKAVQEGNDNYYSTQRINKTVTIVDVDAVKTANASKVKVLATGNGIRVENAKEGETIRVYTTDGLLVKTVRAHQHATEIPLAKDKAFVITVEDKTVKLCR